MTATAMWRVTWSWRRLPGCFTEGLRDSDLCIRYGGEEFLIVTRDRDAAQLAERLRGRIAAHVIDIGGHRTVSVTASFGIAVQRDGGACVAGPDRGGGFWPLCRQGRRRQPRCPARGDTRR